MHDFLAPEVEKKRDHKHTQTKNASNQVSLNFLQKTQQDISDLIEDFLADKNMSIEETFDELE